MKKKLVFGILFLLIILILIISIFFTRSYSVTYYDIPPESSASFIPPPTGCFYKCRGISIEISCSEPDPYFGSYECRYQCLGILSNNCWH